MNVKGIILGLITIGLVLFFIGLDIGLGMAINDMFICSENGAVAGLIALVLMCIEGCIYADSVYSRK